MPKARRSRLSLTRRVVYVTFLLLWSPCPVAYLLFLFFLSLCLQIFFFWGLTIYSQTGNIRLGLKICRILQIDPYDLVLGEQCSIHSTAKKFSKPPGKKKNDSWNGRSAYSDPTANIALYNVSAEWYKMKRLAIRLRLNGEEPDPMLFTGIFRRFITDPLEELM